MESFFSADLTDKEWAEIKQIAVESLDNGMYDRSWLKCAVNAYVTFMMREQAKREPIDGEVIH